MDRLPGSAEPALSQARFRVSSMYPTGGLVAVVDTLSRAVSPTTAEPIHFLSASFSSATSRSHLPRRHVNDAGGLLVQGFLDTGLR
jgi:hypothetical protein